MQNSEKTVPPRKSISGEKFRDGGENLKENAGASLRLGKRWTTGDIGSWREGGITPLELLRKIAGRAREEKEKKEANRGVTILKWEKRSLSTTKKTKQKKTESIEVALKGLKGETLKMLVMKKREPRKMLAK